MNKIFKVIWSKSKQCYVVVSEMAKNTTGKKKIIVASILAGLATQSCSVMAAGAPSSSNNVWGATTPGGVAIGQNSVASGATAVDPATGTVRVAPSIAIGLASSSAGLDTITIGIGAGNTKSYGISMGKQTNVGGDYGIAIGYQTSAMSDHAVAIGEQTRAPKMGATVMGVSARGYGQGSVSLGWQALAGADVYGSGINIGTDPYKDTTTTINSYQKWGDTAIGLRAVATGGNATALGRSARAAAENSIAIGGGNGDNFNNNTEKTVASAAKATAIGYNAKATAGDTLALGTSSKASGSDALAVGVNANASNSDSIAIGQDTVSNNINSVAFGRSSQATGSSATALGAHTKAIDTGAVAIGLKAEATKEGSISIGQQSAASGLKAITTGYLSAASGENAAAYGNTAKAVGKNSLALGANTQATVEGGVALGAGSIANTVAGAGYNPNTGRSNTFAGLTGNALTSTWAAVSIGDGTNTRQLTGLAAGTNNTDAVNVAQLKSMNLAFTADGSTKGDVNLTNSALNVVGDSTYITTKGNNQTLTISGKKQNITVTNGTASASAGMADANNVAQAINQANADQTISYKANNGTANTVKVSDGLNFTNGTSTVATVGANGQVTYDLNSTTKQSITDSSTAVNRTIALGGSTGSTTAKKLASGDAKLTAAVTAAESAANKDLSNLSTAGNTNIQNLAKTAAAWNVSTNGSGSTTVSGGDTVNFVNGDNIAVTNTGRTITIGTAKNVSFDKVTVGGISIDKTAGINAGNKEIKGLATGTTATSAVNKQQMEDAVKAASDATTALGNHTIALGSDSGSTTAKKLSTSAIAFNIKGDTGANALITTTATGDNVSITPTAKLTAAVAAAENAANKNLSNISSSGETVIKNLAKGAAQDAVKVAGTGLATVSDNTVGGVKTYTVDVNTGNLVVAANGQVGAAGTTGASGAAGSNGVATTQNVATAINDAVTKAKASTTQALADAEHKFAGDTGTTSVRKHGEVLSIKGGVTAPADLSTGNIGVVSDGAGTLNIRLAKVLSGLTSATFTTAGGNTTVINGAGVTITPSGAGASAISMTTDGINAGGTEIKNIADGTAADSAVSKGQMETAIANAQTAATSTEKVVAKTLSGDNNLATVTGQTGTAKGETYEVSVSENAVKNVAKAAAQDAVTVTGTGLATVSDNTAAGVKTYTVNVDEGKLVIDDTTGKVGAAGSTQGTTAGKNGVATTQNVATAINDAVTKANANNAQALADAKHNFAGDDATVISRKHGEQLNIKGGASTTATDLTSGNIAVVGDTTTGTLNIKMAKALTGLTSATYTDGAGNTQTVTGGSSTITDGAGNTTTITKGGVTTTDAAGNTTTTAPTGVTVTPAGAGATPISVTTSGIRAGNKEIKNVANGTTDDAAVNKKQMDDALKGATDNTVSLGSESGTTTAKKLSTTGGIKFNIKGETGANALITTSATGDDVTIAPTAKLSAAVTAAEKSADKDLSNLSAAGDTYIKNLAKTAASWNVETNGSGTTAVAGGESVNFVNGDNIAITNAGRAITIGTAKNVAFDKVTVGGVVLDKTDGINAGGKEVKGIADGTAADSAVSKGQMETAIANAQTAATSTEKVIAKALTGDTNLATVTGQTGTAKGETYEVAVSENAVKNVAKAAAQDAVTVTGTGLATVSSNTTGGVKTYTVNVDEGKLVLDDTTGKIGANGSTQGTTAGKNGVATTQNVATAINDAVTKANANNAQALADAKHNFAGDDATVISRKHGEQLNIKGGASTTATDLTSGNIAVVGDTASGTLNIKMAKALTGLTSATFTDGSGNTQTVTGASSTITDGAGNTTTMTKGGLSTTDGTNTTTVAPAGVTATDGTNTVKLNGSGIDAGNTQIKNVGKATTDDAAVNKKQMDDAVKAATDATTALGNNTIALGSDAGSTTAKKLSTNAITFNIKGDTGANALITTSATANDVTIAPTAKLTDAVTAAEKSADKDLSNISSAGKTVIKDLAVTSAQDAVNVTGTGLATVSSNTTGGVKTYTVDVKAGNLVVDANGQAGAAGATGTGGAVGTDGVATTQNVATAINDAIAKSNANAAQALADAEHKFDGDTGTTSVRKHGEVLSIKGGVANAADLATGNIGVVSDGAGTLNIRLAKALTGLTSATFTDGSGNTQTVTGASSTITDGAGNTTAMTKGGLSTTDGTNTTTVAPAGVTATDGTNTVKLNGSGIDAGNTQIKNVGKATTDDAAVNKKQMDDAVKAATDATTALGNNTIALGSDAGSTTAKKLSTNAITFNIKGDTGANALITTSATGDDVTIAPTAKLTAAVTAAEKSADKDLSNISSAGKTVIKDLAVTSAQDAVKVTGTGLATVSDNTTGGVKTYTVNVDEGKLVLDDTTGQIGANGSTQGTTAGKNGVATTQNVATAINDAIAKSNANTAQALADAEHKFDGDTGTTSVRKHGEVLSIKGGVSNATDLTTGNIGVVSDGAGTLNIRLAKVLSGLTSATFKDASGNTTMVTGGSTTIADTAGNTQTLAPTKSEIKDNNGVSTVTTKDGVTAKDASGQTTSLTKGGVDATDGNGNTTSLTNTGVSATDGNGHTTGLTNGGLSTTDGTNTTTVAPTGITATDGTNTVKLNGSGIDAGNTEIKNVGKATTDDAAVNKKQMDDAITKATADATHEFGGDDATVVSRKHGEKLTIKGGATTTDADLTSGNIAVIGDATNGALNIKLAKALTGLTSATYTDTAGNTTTVTGGSTTIADTSGNSQTLAPTKSEIKDNNGVSTVTTKDGVTAKDASGQTTSLTKGGVDATDGNGNTTSLTNTGVSATDGNGHTTGLTNGGLSTTDGTNTTTVAPTGMTATDGTNTVKVEGSGIDAGGTQIKNVGKATTDDAAVNKKQMDDAITKATADATHEFGGDDATVVSRKHGEKLTIKGGATTTDADLTSGNIAVIGDATNGALNIKLAKALTGLTSATYTDTAGNTTTVTGGSTTIADTSGNSQTLAPTKSEIKDNNGVSTVTTKDGVTAKDASGQTTSLTKGGVDATDGNGNTTSLTNTGVSATDGNGHTTGLTNGGLSTTDGTNTTTVAPTGMTTTDGTNTVKVEGSGIDAGGTEIKHIAAGTAADSAVNKGQMDDAITKATADATHEFAGDTGSNSVRKHGEVLSIKGGVTDTNKLSDNNIGVISDGAGTLNVKLSKDLTGLTSATFKDGSGNTQTVTGGSSTITDGAGNITTITKDGVITTDAAGNTTTTAPTGVTVTPAGAGATPISVTTSGISAGNKEIKNVANGTTDDAAVNKKQMDEAVKAASDATKALGNNTITLGGDSVSTTTAKALNTTGGIQFNIKGQTGTDALITTSASGDDVTITPTDKLTNAVTAAEKSADKDLSNLSAAGNTHIRDLAKSAASWNVQTNGNGTTAVVGGDTVNFIDGDNIAITNTGHAITIGTAKNVSFDKVTVGGMTLDKNGILSGISSITGSGTGAPTMTFNSQNGNTPANVSINSNLDMGGHRITGVGPAEKPTDAVNKQQVDQALRGLAGLADNAARQYASKAGANAAALAALKPIQYDPLEPTQIMAGVGNYKSQTAVALGMAHYTNENTMFNIGVSLDSHDNMVNAGVTHKFGYSPEKKAIPDRYKGGPISSIYVMQDEMQALLAKDQEKDAVISKQASEIDTLRQQNEDMQRKIDMILAKLQ